MSVKDMAANFERKMNRRVVISGHGSYRDGDAKITVPHGKTLYFYVRHGEGLSNAVGMAVEGLEGGTPPAAIEVFKGGDQVYNYILTYPSNLTLNGTSQNAKYDWITVARKGEAIPLSTLFKDSRCQTASEIHWAACRSQANWLKLGHESNVGGGSVKFAR